MKQLLAQIRVVTCMMILTMVVASPKLAIASMNFSLPDDSSDVIKFTLENGFPTNMEYGLSEGSVDILGINVSFSTDPAQNTTVKITFSGTPLVDEYHYYWMVVSGSAYMANNDTHFIGFLIHVAATRMTDDSGNPTDLTIHHAVLEFDNPDSYMNEYFGIEVGVPIGLDVSGSIMTFSFNIHQITGPPFANVWSSVTSIDLSEESPFQEQVGITSGLVAEAYKSNAMNQTIDEGSGTFWADFVPNNESVSIVPGLYPSETSTPSSDSSQETDLTNGKVTGLELPTSSFTAITTIFSVIAAVIMTRGVFFRKRKHY